jgi:hypothetical protein
MPEQFVHVETYSGFKADERPLRLHLGQRTLEVAQVEDRWYSPGETYFRVRVTDGDRYVLRHTEAQDVWRLVGYRAKEVAHSGYPGGLNGSTQHQAEVHLQGPQSLRIVSKG